MGSMEVKQHLVLDKINQTYYPIIMEYHLLGSCHYFVKAQPNAPEKYHLIANAANKFWNLIEL